MQHDNCRTLAADADVDSRTISLDLFGPESGWKRLNSYRVSHASDDPCKYEPSQRDEPGRRRVEEFLLASG